MSTIYITEQGAILKKSGERLIVSVNNQTLFERHFRYINRILIFGNAQITSQLTTKLFQEGIDLSFFSRNGIYRGQLVTNRSKNIYVKIAQISHWSNKQFLLELAKINVERKIQGQLAVLKKRRSGVKIKIYPLSSTILTLEKSIEDIRESTNITSLRGIEGNAARLYFSCWDTILPPELPFEKRTRRPALNGINSALNFSYTLLLNECNSLLEAYGFDVMLGFYHSIRYGRVSLSLDLMEMFRPLLVDEWIIKITRMNQIQKTDFYLDEEKGIYFTDSGRKKFLKLYQTWHKETSYRDHIEAVIKGLEKSNMEGKVDAFRQSTEEVLSNLL